jgi:hypothetical protein
MGRRGPIGGRPWPSTAMLFSLGFIVLFILGGITGIMIAAVPFNWQVHDTHFIVAHFHYTLVGGSIFPIFAAIYFWFPKVTGTPPGRALGRWHFWLFLVGFNLTFLLMHLTGLEGMPRRVYTYLPGLGWDTLNLVSTAGPSSWRPGSGSSSGTWCEAGERARGRRRPLGRPHPGVGHLLPPGQLQLPGDPPGVGAGSPATGVGRPTARAGWAPGGEGPPKGKPPGARGPNPCGWGTGRSPGFRAGDPHHQCPHRGTPGKGPPARALPRGPSGPPWPSRWPSWEPSGPPGWCRWGSS